MISVNCTSLPYMPINGILLKLTLTTATIGYATDNTSNIVTVMCINRDVWSHTDLINCPLPSMETLRKLQYINHILYVCPTYDTQSIKLVITQLRIATHTQIIASENS